MTFRVFITGLVNSFSVGVPMAYLLPAVARRMGGRGVRLILTLAGAALLITAAGCLAGAAILLVLGMLPAASFWQQYAFSVRIAGALAVVFTIAIFAFEVLTNRLQEARTQLRERELLAAEARLQSLESRIHPHFLFNTLNSISSLIPANAQLAEDTVGRLAALLRTSLDSSRCSLIPLASELDTVRNYLEIEKTRLRDRLRYRFSIPEAALTVLVPPFSVQCLVENAVKHALAPNIEGGELEIAADGALTLEVRDSGPGFGLDRIEPGHGLENLVARLETLYGPSARLDVARRGGRTVVAFTVPVTRETASLHR